MPVQASHGLHWRRKARGEFLFGYLEDFENSYWLVSLVAQIGISKTECVCACVCSVKLQLCLKNISLNCWRMTSIWTHSHCCRWLLWYVSCHKWCSSCLIVPVHVCEPSCVYKYCGRLLCACVAASEGSGACWQVAGAIRCDEGRGGQASHTNYFRWPSCCTQGELMLLFVVLELQLENYRCNQVVTYMVSCGKLAWNVARKMWGCEHYW